MQNHPFSNENHLGPAPNLCPRRLLRRCRRLAIPPKQRAKVSESSAWKNGDRLKNTYRSIYLN